MCQCKPIRLQKCNKRYVTQQCTKEPVIFQALELDESQCEYYIFCFAFKSKNISMSYLEFTEGTPKKNTKLLHFFLLLFFFFFLIFVCVFVLWLLWVCFGNIRLKSSSNNRELIAHKNEEISFLNLKHLNMSHFNIYNFDKERQIRRFRCNANHLTYLWN